MSFVRKAGPMLGATLLCAFSAHAQVFINEIHYDNSGTDTGERVEVVAPAGTSFSGYKVVLYNGGDGRSYATLNLSGTATNQCGGFGTTVVAATGLQNGAPDGLALVNASNQVVQFLSYEGSFSAIDGPASGRASSNIGVSEAGTEPAGQSLQLSGSGSSAANFSWNAPRAASFGSCNSGQSFVPPDAAPTVSATLPSGGATAVARNANLSVQFSEPVTASSGWLTLSCPSGARTLAISGGPQTYTADPSVDFNASETCTATVQANRIADQDQGTATSMLANYSFSFTTAANTGGGTGYYASVNTSSAAALRASLHALIDDHSKIPYTASTTDVWDVLDRAEQDPLNSARVLDIYKNASYAKAAGGNSFYNREHTWPKSLGFPNDGASNYPYSDTHMLMASDIAYNADRGNLPFDDCGASCRELPTQNYAGQGGGSGVYPGNSNWVNSSVFEVWSKRKGDLARAVLYMDIRYEGGSHGASGAAEPNLVLTDNLALITSTGSNASIAYMGKLSTLLRWSAQDPPTEAERLRNTLIQSYQGNRNPFVDHPEWLDCLYRNICR
jgi:endonuclease I